MLDDVYHKKRFYKVTWERSEVLRREIPWLKDEKHEFCMIGYREPTPEEAERFIGKVMYDRLFDRVCDVTEISKAEALRDFEMSNWKHQAVFGYDELHPVMASLAERLQDATIRAEEQGVGRSGFEKERGIGV